MYVAVDSPNLGFPYFNYLGGYQLKKNTLYLYLNKYEVYNDTFLRTVWKKDCAWKLSKIYTKWDSQRL